MDPMDEDPPAMASADDNPPPASSSTPAPSGASGKHHASTPLAPGASSNNPSAAPSSSSSQAASQNALNISKRRRGLGIVTPNACTECRKKRAKCDGQKPCGRCKVQKDADCVYEVPVRQSKDTLRHEIELLRRQQRSNEQVFSALVRPDVWEEVLTRLRGGQSIETISDWLGGTLPSGGGAMPNLAGRSHGPGGANIPPVSGFAGGGQASYSGMAPGLSAAVSPVSSQHPGVKYETDQPSPWGGQFSSQSQTVSTRSDSHPDIMNWSSDTIRGPSQSRVGSWVSETADSSSEGHRFQGMDQILAPEVPEIRIPPGTWTDITSDSQLVQHLLALYFCWEYPTFASLSKEHFIRDFQDGRARFCSPILVNALLALGCRFSSKPTTRAIPNDPHTSGDHFFKECQRLFNEEDNHHTLTTIQALGIMSIREASCGRDSESWYYAGQSIRLAIEMGLHRIHDDGYDDDEAAVQAATFWGAFALDHAWSLATGSLPQCSCFPRLPPKPAIIDDIEASLWIPYTDDGVPLQRSCEQPSNVRSVYKCFCELSELVHQSLYILHSPGRPLTSRDLLSIYTQYLNWYDRIPGVLRLGHNFTPAVLFAHMYYHFAILLLFRPLIKLRILGSKVSPRDVCIQAADAIQGLLRSYSQLYTLRRTPSFVPYFVLTSSIVHLAIGASPPSAETPEASGASSQKGPPSPTQQRRRPSKIEPRVAEAISQGIADLTEMAPCHHFAEQALNILRYLAKKWDIEVEIKRGTGDEGAVLDSDDEDDGTTRPVTSSLNFFAPNVQESDFISSFTTGAPPDGSVGAESRAGVATGGLRSMGNAMENPLFWPFPMQGRPLLPTGQMLKEAGFELL
ncbi:hypothetical protein GQ53DRAFT_399706 [Thozetella sp. PMI_491]|nr:hypothetical protein GQ53DRAFT_399706 [Thozetella sp. PMI_491]